MNFDRTTDLHRAVATGPTPVSTEHYQDFARSDLVTQLDRSHIPPVLYDREVCAHPPAELVDPAARAQPLVWEENALPSPRRWVDLSAKDRAFDGRRLDFVGNEPEFNRWLVPDFFPLGDKHVLLTAATTRGQSGKSIYMIGAYQDLRFEPESEGFVDAAPPSSRCRGYSTSMPTGDCSWTRRRRSARRARRTGSTREICR